jgi:hypothetical protein
MGKKLTLKGTSVACLTAAICSRRRSGVSMAAGNEPSPPARQTAIVSSGPCAPAIGAWMRGIFDGRKVIEFLSWRRAQGSS